MPSDRIPARFLTTMCGFLTLIFFGSGCAEEGPPRAAVTGTVTVDDEPLQKGSIRFIPTDETKGPEAGAKIENGFYELSEEDGPVVGTVRVEIRDVTDPGYDLDDPEQFVEKGDKPLPRPRIPPKYNRRSKITRTIKAGEVNELNFTIRTEGRNVRR